MVWALIEVTWLLLSVSGLALVLMSYLLANGLILLLHISPSILGRRAIWSAVMGTLFTSVELLFSVVQLSYDWLLLVAILASNFILATLVVIMVSIVKEGLWPTIKKI